MEQNNLEKQIKRNIYGKPQSVLVTFPPGYATQAREEIQSILDHLWFQNKFTSEMTMLKKAIRIDQIHFFAIVELLMRGQCISDIRLVVSEERVANMVAFEKACHDISWGYFISHSMAIKVKVDAGASPALHEGAMKEVIGQCVEAATGKLVTGENADESTMLYADVYKYQLTMSISLAGAPLFKRGYRSELSNSAPLREDMAACCIRKAHHFAIENNKNYTVDTLLIPFSGTGTFLFEYWIERFRFAPVLFGRQYALLAMPLFRQENFQYLLKKAIENSDLDIQGKADFYCIDQSSSANAALVDNLKRFKAAAIGHDLSWCDREDDAWLLTGDFLQMDVASVFKNLSGNIFIPLNPPYGIRLGASTDTVVLYKNIARQVNALFSITKKTGKHVLGFILCPSEETWSAFCSTISYATIDTYHMTQGGLDIRVAQFLL